MPRASVGAPPVRDRIEASPTSAAAWLSCSGVMTKPMLETAVAADSTVVPIKPAGLLTAKYSPGSSTQAAVSAMMATKLSIAMAP